MSGQQRHLTTLTSDLEEGRADLVSEVRFEPKYVGHIKHGRKFISYEQGRTLVPSSSIPSDGLLDKNSFAGSCVLSP